MFKKNANLYSQLQSIGLIDLDAIFKNQIHKGTMIWLNQDSPTTVYQFLITNILGHNYHTKTKTLYYDILDKNYNSIIPNIDKDRKKNNQSNTNTKNEIAYRYNQMDMNQTKLVHNPNDNYYDLNSYVNDPDITIINQIQLLKFQNYQELLSSIYTEYQNILDNEQDSNNKYVIINNLFNPIQQYDDQSLFKLLHALKVFVRASNTILLITTPPNDISSKQTQILLNSCDLALQINPIDDPKYSHFQATLHIIKNSGVNTCKNLDNDYQSYGVKAYSKHKLELEILYENIDAEEGEKEKIKIESLSF